MSYFYEKFLLLKDKMNTKIGYEKAQNRHGVIKKNLENFNSEGNWEK